MTDARVHNGAAGRRPLRGPVGRRERTDCRPRPLEIAYRAGTYETFLRQLLDHVRSQPGDGGEHTGRRPLADFDVDAHHEWAVGLFKAWAEVGDVLSFYQERIANEGFLATAREERSVREIVRLIDYLPHPGVASATRLAYKVLELPGTPEVVVVPERASVTSVPERKELPQTWETVEELHARAEWNALRPRIPELELHPRLAPSATALELAGTDLGLEPGSPLLIELAGAAEPAFRRLTEVTEVEPETADGVPYTRVAWRRPLVPEPTPETPAELEVGRVVTFGQELSLFGHDAPAWAEVDDEVKARYARPLGGVVLSGAGDGWRSVNRGLPEDGVGAVLAAPDGSLYAGTPNGIFRSIDHDRWSRSGADLVGQEILTLASDGRQQLFAGTARNGVLRSTDGESWEVLLGEAAREPLMVIGPGRRPRSGRLPQSPVRAVLASGSRVFAGTDHGVFVFEQRSDTWQAVNKGLPDWAPKTGRAGVVVQALVAGGAAGELFAGTDRGVFHSRSSGRSWEPRNGGLPGFDAATGDAKLSVLALQLEHDRRTGASLLMAGTDLGAFRSLDGGRSWEPVSLGLPATDLETGLSKTPVSALTLATDPLTLERRHFAATAEGLFVSSNAGVYWTRADGELVGRPVGALARSASGGLVVAVPPGGFDRDRWPGFRIRRGELDLVEAEPGIEEGDWLVLLQAGDGDDAAAERRAAVVRAARVQQLVREEFSLEAVITRATADRPIERSDEFDLRTARVLAGSRQLALPVGRRRRLEPLAVDRVELDAGRPLPAFAGPRAVTVDGRLLRVRLAAGTSARTDDGRWLSIRSDSEPRVVSCRAAGRALRLRLSLAGGLEGEVAIEPTRLSWRPARDEDPPVAESVTAEWSPAADAASGPALALRPTLRHCYDPTTVRILGNTVLATQGKTVYRDVVGNGDATRPHQRFAISAPPLTYLQTGGAERWASTLEIRVGGVRWREVESLYSAGPDDRVYVIRHDIDGVATVVFGDGVHGARLPTGRQNVVALYRSGFWPDAVNRGRLTVAETKPLGLDGVTNPLPAAAAAPPESADESRTRAPVSLRALGRIVSLRDYEDFCQTYPGVARARVARLATPRGELVQITVATTGGDPVRRGGELHRALLEAVEAARADRTPLSIDGCRRGRFELAARVRHALDRRAVDVERAVRERLLAAFRRDRACFGERITASRIVALVREAPGVASVQLTRFHRSTLERAVESSLDARPARWDGDSGRVLPAELLELRQPGGLLLETVADR